MDAKSKEYLIEKLGAIEGAQLIDRIEIRDKLKEKLHKDKDCLLIELMREYWNIMNDRHILMEKLVKKSDDSPTQILNNQLLEKQNEVAEEIRKIKPDFNFVKEFSYDLKNNESPLTKLKEMPNTYRVVKDMTILEGSAKRESVLISINNKEYLVKKPVHLFMQVIKEKTQGRQNETFNVRNILYDLQYGEEQLIPSSYVTIRDVFTGKLKEVQNLLFKKYDEGEYSCLVNYWAI